MASVTGISCTEADLRGAAGERSFERGLTYIDAVDGLLVLGHQVTATVRGSADYQVLLTFARPVSLSGTAGSPGVSPVRGECSCPYGRAGFFCKHCVAVGLAVVRAAAPIVPAQRTEGRTSAQASDPSGARGQDAKATQATDSASARRQDAKAARANPGSLQSWLVAQNRDELLLLVLEQVIVDDDWRRCLELRAAGAAADLTAILARLGDVLGLGELGQYGYVQDGDSARYAHRVRQVAQVIESLTGRGHAGGAIEIAQEALTLAASACRNADDRSGSIGAAVADLVASHRAACLAEPPDPASLADFLAERALSENDLPAIEFGAYGDLLGKAGLARLRERLTAAWQADPASWRAQDTLERLLRLTGDTEALARVVEAGRDAPGRKHLRIAAELERAGRPQEALAWAERGLAESVTPDEQLTDDLAARFWALGRGEDAVAVRRARFAAARDLGAFRRLRADAERALAWPASREWALGLLRADASAGSAGPVSGHQEGGPVLLDALIDEGDLDAAWDLACGVASDGQLLRLADLMAKTRPADALEVYLRQLAALKSGTGEHAYQRMARLLTSARACHARLGTHDAFGAYLREFRAEHKRKRRLISILDARQLR